MADEQAQAAVQQAVAHPQGLRLAGLLAKDGDELEIHYRHTLEELGKRSGMLGVIFRKAQNKIQDPAKLRRLIVDLIDKEQWSSLSADVKGDAYEGLLQKNAEDVKGGAGQYFTPRPLIAAMVDVVASCSRDRPSVIRRAARAVSCSRRMITLPSTTRSTGRKRRGSRAARSSASSWWTASRGSAR